MDDKIKKTTPLFRLIKSLTKSEKVYFKKFASQHVIGEKNNYVKLFDAIDKSNEYDEGKLRKYLKGSTVLDYLAEAKYYLHKLILKSLDAFHSASSIDAKIREGLNAVEILYKKQLPEDALHLLLKTKKMAQEYQRFLLQIELLKWERRLSIEMDDANKIETFQNTFYKETKALLEEENILFQNMMFSDVFLSYGIKYTLEEKGYLSKIESLYKEILPDMRKMEKLPLSFEASRFLSNAYRQYYTMKGDYKNAYTHSRAFLKVIESNPSQISANPGTYMRILHNHFLCLIMLEKFDEADVTIKKMKAVPSKYLKTVDENMKLLVFNVFHMELSLYHKMGRFHEAVRQIELQNVEEKLKMYKGKINRPYEVVLFDNITWAYFIAGDYHSALKWINRLLNDTQLENIREHTHCLLRILNLMIHFELGHDDYIDRITRTTSKYLKKRERLYQCETGFIKFLQEVFGVKTSVREILFQKLKKELAKLENDRDENSIIEQLRMRSWIDSKLKGITFEEQILKEMKK